MGKGAKGGAMVKPFKVLEVEKDTHKLVSQPKEEYPDWLFEMRITRPHPTLEELEP